MNMRDLQKREAYIVQAILEGMTAKEVANALGMTTSSRGSSVRNMFYAALLRRAPELCIEGRYHLSDEHTVLPPAPELEWCRDNKDRILDRCNFLNDKPAYFLAACESITE